MEAARRRWLTEHRYLLLAVAVVVLTASQTRNGQWSSDMWEHVAVVRELIARPGHPEHPQLLLDAPHPGFSPYAVVLGVVGRAFDLAPVTVLSWAAIGNVGLLLVALRSLVRAATGDDRAPFWALLFVLLLWGVGPFRYSGFFGLGSIGFVAPYPSTFATAVAFATLVAALRFARGASVGWLAGVAAGAALVLLVHPLSAPWLAMALVVVGALRVRPWARLAAFAASGAAAVGLAVAWPYFSIVDLVRGSGELEGLNRSMYAGVLPRTFPLLLGVVAIARRWRSDRGDLLTAWLVGAALLYGLGAALDNTSLGRTLAFIVVLLAVAVAASVSRVEGAGPLRAQPPPVRWAAAGLGGLLVLGAVTAASGAVRMVPDELLPGSVREAEELVRPDERYAFLVGPVGPTDVVLASRKADDRVIPSLTGRTVVLAAPRPFIDDLAERDRAQRELLDVETPPARRAALLERYEVRFVLLRTDRRDEPLREQLEADGATVEARAPGFVLLRR